ncbi:MULTISPECIES: hypothetical protein [unclassified Roseitalea]|uniref:hypothetical protein n=1 Tax=unclassified Roseitalea TaxID=2639107 RepID=UPI00273DDC41|nr:MULTISPECIES: hypothetical protein [unclassified Roseitalea]
MTGPARLGIALVAAGSVLAGGAVAGEKRFVLESGDNTAVLLLPEGEAGRIAIERDAGGGTIRIEDEGSGNSFTFMQLPAEATGD